MFLSQNKINKKYEIITLKLNENIQNARLKSFLHVTIKRKRNSVILH